MYTHRIAPLCAFLVVVFCFVTIFAGCQAPSGASASDANDGGGGGGGDSIDPAGTDGGDDQYNTVIDEPTDEQYDDYTISASPAEAGDPGEWSFKVEAKGRPIPTQLTWVWDFGDGQTANGVTQNHVYATGGSYKIIVKAKKSDGSVAFTLTLNITVTVPPLPDQPPVANAGQNQTVDEGALGVCLNASASSDVNNDPLTFQWRQIAGTPGVTLVPTGNGAVACFAAPNVDQDAELVFAVTVSDGDHAAEDTVSVVVQNVVDPSATLTADAGADIAATAGDPVSLDGSGSSAGAARAVLTYLWTQVAGTPAVLQSATTAVATFTAPVVTSSETLRFRLTVTYGELTAFDEVGVAVSPAAPPPPPPPPPPGCTGDAECDDGLFCTGAETCVSGSCQAGTVPCSGQQCDEAADACVACLDNAHCDDGLFCNGSETCVGGACQAGTPPMVADGVACTVDACDENADVILHTPNNGACDDSQFCNGAESCNPASGCVAGTAPCGGQQCDETANTCVACLNNAQCDDGQFCNGAETCVGGACQAGTPPAINDGVGCTVDACDENADVVLHTPNNGACNDGLFCNGTETCNATAGCLSGAAPCTGQTCDEATDTCVALPALSVSPGALDFGTTATTRTFEVWNSGGGTLSYTVSDNAAWLTVSPATGTSTGEHDIITATANRTGLVAGTYSAVITVTPAGGPPATINVTLTVAAAPAVLSLSASALDFGSSSTSLTFEVWNSGGGTLSYTISDNAAWLTVSPATGTSTGEHDIITATASRTGLVAGSYSAVVTVTPGSGSPATISVTLTVPAAPPVLSLSVSAIDFGSSPVSVTFEVWNSGGGTLDYTVGDNAAWLTVSPGSGTSTGEHDTITATVDRTGLADGPYQGQITVTPSVGTAITIAVSMTVGASTAQPMTTASRTSGVAPLAVFFDAVNTSSPDVWASGVIQPADGDYAALHYKWKFNDTYYPPYPDPSDPKKTVDPSKWKTNDKSKDKAIGYVAAHVFEKPGTYWVDLDVTSNGHTEQYKEKITVLDPDTEPGWTTYYVSNNENPAQPVGSDTNSGLSPSVPFKTFPKAMSMLKTNTRILFKRGDTWTITSGATISAAGPGILDAYGDSQLDPPRITLTASGRLLNVNNRNDWRICDLDLRRPSLSSGAEDHGVVNTGTNCLYLRCRLSGFHYGWVYAATPRDGVTVAECEIAANWRYGLFVGGAAGDPSIPHFALMGCDFGDVTVSHQVRSYVTKSLLAHNTFRGNCPGIQIKFCGANAPYKGEYCIISDNRFLNPISGTWMVTIGPEDPLGRILQRVENVVVERNIWDVGSLPPPGRTAIQSSGANNITIRNNLFIGVARAVIAGMGVPGFSTWNNWKVYNNSAYRVQTDDAVFIGGEGLMTNLQVRNNIVSWPDSAGYVRVLDFTTTPLAEIMATNNIWYLPHADSAMFSVAGGTYPSLAAWQTTGKDAGSKPNDPLFVSPRSDPANLHLDASGQTKSPAIDSGVFLPWVFEDFDGRPVGSAPDMGAYEYGP